MKARYALGMLTLVCSPAYAADERRSAKVIDDVAQCRQVPDTTARLSCYDRAAAALSEATDKKLIVVLDRTEVQRTRRSLFGFTLPKLPFFGNDDKDDADRKTDVTIQELTTTITRVGPWGYGLWSITLAEGGTWRTIEADRTLEPRVGMAITIKRGALGNYIANIGGKRAIRVQRIG